MSENVTVNVTARTARKGAQALLVASLYATKGKSGLSKDEKAQALLDAANLVNEASLLLTTARDLIVKGKPSTDLKFPENVAKTAGLFVPPVTVPDEVPAEWVKSDVTDADTDGETA